MAIVKIEGHIYRHAYLWSTEPSYCFFNFDATDEDRVKVQEHTIEVEIPDDFDPRPAQVQALQAAKEKLQAEFTARIVEINSKISNLQCIEFNPTPTPQPVVEMTDDDYPF